MTDITLVEVDVVSVDILSYETSSTNVTSVIESVEVGLQGPPGLQGPQGIQGPQGPSGPGAAMVSIVASEALSAGNVVNVWLDGSTPKVRKADATMAGKEADGFVLEAVNSGGDATVYFEGLNHELTALTPGSRYYLATTAGTITANAPSVTGNVLQYVGRAVSTTSLTFAPDEGTVL